MRVFTHLATRNAKTMKAIRQRLSALLCLPLLLSACAGAGTAGHFQAQQPAADSSLLYLYRPTADNPGLQPLRFAYPDIQLDGRSIGQLPFNSHFAAGLSPGQHKIRITGLSQKANWELPDIEQSFSVSAGEVKYLKLDVRHSYEMDVGQSTPDYQVFLTPMGASDALQEIRTTSAQD